MNRFPHVTPKGFTLHVRIKNKSMGCVSTPVAVTMATQQPSAGVAGRVIRAGNALFAPDARGGAGEEGRI